MKNLWTIVTFIAIAAGLALSIPRFAHAADESKAEQRKLFRQGAQLWPVYCAQCHQARPGGQFSPVQWNTIMMHMRTQSEMPAKDARAILEYLKAGR